MRERHSSQPVSSYGAANKRLLIFMYVCWNFGLTSRWPFLGLSKRENSKAPHTPEGSSTYLHMNFPDLSTTNQKEQSWTRRLSQNCPASVSPTPLSKQIYILSEQPISRFPLPHLMYKNVQQLWDCGRVVLSPSHDAGGKDFTLHDQVFLASNGPINPFFKEKNFQS